MGKSVRLSRSASVLGAAGAMVITLCGSPPASADSPSTEGSGLARSFQVAADRYDVPRALLVGIGYAESHLDGHAGQPSQDNGFGVMHLTSNPENRTLTEAKKLTGLATGELRKDAAANILGAAAVLDSYADKAGLSASDRDDVAQWYSVVARYSHTADAPTARLYTDEVYSILGKGVKAKGVSVAANKVTPDRGKYAKVSPLGAKDAAASAADHPGAIWNPASASNYQVGGRASYGSIVIHVTQGSYAGTISWFKNPEAQVSAHYVVRSSDGQITQMVAEKDVAYHARSANSTSVGIEHEGYVADPAWFTDAMYRSSAALTKSIADRRGIPKDRAHIVGHSEVPGNDHTDPGSNWDWNYYMELVGGGAGNPDPPTYNFSTYGAGVRVRSDASLTASVVGSLAGPTQVFVECQKQGDSVTAEGHTNSWWAKLRDQGGFISNIYIADPAAKLPGVPDC